MNTSIPSLTKKLGSIFLLLMMIVLWPTSETNATHIVGGELSYRVIGFQQVEIILTVRRDCALGDPEADLDDPAYFRVFDQNNEPIQAGLIGGLDNMSGFNVALGPNDTLVEMIVPCASLNWDTICVQQATYRKVINLRQDIPSIGAYKIVYQRCCRNASLTNVVDPLNSGMTLEVNIPVDQLIRRNQSAMFPSNFPPIYACVGDPISVSQQAFDPDGDSLVYKLFTPNLGATFDDPYPAYASEPPYDPVVWAANHPLSNLMNSPNDPVRIDQNTGLLTFTAENIGQYLIGICVEELSEDGRVVNTVCREFEVNTGPCGDQARAVIDTDTDIQCDDLTIDWSSAGSDGTEFIWVFKKDNNRDTVFAENPTYTFPDTGCYSVCLTVNNDAGCYDVDSTIVCLYETGVDSADFDIEMLECVDSMLIKVTDATVYSAGNPLAKITWDATIGNMVVAADSGSMFTFPLEENALVTICQYLELANGCEIQHCEDIQFNLLTLDFDRDQVLCLGEETDITVSHTQGDDITVTWEDNDIIVNTNTNGTTITVLTPDSINTTLHFTATNEYGCSVMDSILVTTAGERPDSFSWHVIQSCNSLDIQIVNNSNDTFDVIWDFGDGSPTSTVWAPSHTYDAAGTYTITGTAGEAPCDTVVSMTLMIPIQEVDFPDTAFQCFGDSLTLNPGGNADWTYQWAPSELFSDVNAVSPKILVDVPTDIYVTVTVNSGESYCTHIDTILAFPVPDFQFDVTPNAEDITVCGEEDEITLSVDAMEGVEITWKDANGMEIGTGDSITVSLENGLNEFTVMGSYMGLQECMKMHTFNITLNQIMLDFMIMNVDDGTDMFCEPAEGKLIVKVDGPPGNYTYQWAPDTNVISGINDDSLCINVMEDITYCVTVTNTDLDCSVSGCYSIDFGAEVNAVVVDPQEVICVGEKVTVVASIDPPGADCNYDWIVPGTVIGPDDRDTICFTATMSGDIIVQVGCVGGCTSSDTTTITVVDLSAQIQISVEPDPVEYDSQTVFLNVIGGDPNWEYLWDGPGIDDPTSQSTTATPGRGSHTFTVMVTDPETGCTGSASYTTAAPPDNPCEHPFVFLPTAFSPNDDGMNDILHVYGAQITSIVDFIIYNRWGQEVYRVSNVPNASWDGKMNGTPLETDVYGYYLRVLCENGDESIQQGNINLLR